MNAATDRHDSLAASQTPQRKAQAEIRIYEPEHDLIWRLRQWRNELKPGETSRIEIEIDPTTHDIIIVNVTTLRRVVLAAQ